MTLQHLDTQQASLEQASALLARPDWERKATANASCCTCWATWREMEHHLKSLHHLGRLADGASFARITPGELAVAAERTGV